MREEDFPALYRSADNLAIASQNNFLSTLRVHLSLLVVAAGLSVFNFPTWHVAALQVLVLAGALFCSVYLFVLRKDRFWYAGRAVAESIKTVVWRWVCRAEPFEDDANARVALDKTLSAIIQQNKEVVEKLTDYLGERQVTEEMGRIRSSTLQDRRENYTKARIEDQLGWYTRKAKFNRRTASRFFWLLIGANACGMALAIARISFPATPYWPTEIFVTLAASLLGWMQAKRYSELAASYALTAHEIGLVREQAEAVNTEGGFSKFVGDAENAFSREHTQWVARKDV